VTDRGGTKENAADNLDSPRAAGGAARGESGCLVRIVPDQTGGSVKLGSAGSVTA